MNLRLISITLLLTAFISAAYGLGIYLFSTLVPDMRGDLGLTQEMVGRIAGICQAGTIVASLVIGSVWGRIGAKTTVIAAQAIIAVTMISISLSTSSWQIMIAVGVLGMMAASTWIPLVPLVQAVIPPKRQGIVLGLASSGLAYGVFVVGFVAPLLIASFGWRSVWLAAGLYAATLCLLGAVVLAKLPPVRPDAPSVRGLQADPHLLFSLPALLMITINFLAGLAFHPFQTYLTLLFRDLHHWSMPSAAALWSAIGAGGMVGGVVFGALADRFGAKVTLVFANGMLLAAAITVWLVSLPVPVYGAMIAFGMAYNAIWGLYATWMARNFTGNGAARLMGFTLVSSGIGATAGNYSGGLITSLSGGYSLLYMLVAILVALQVIFSLALPSRPLAV